MGWTDLNTQEVHLSISFIQPHDHFQEAKNYIWVAILVWAWKTAKQNVLQ